MSKRNRILDPRRPLIPVPWLRDWMARSNSVVYGSAWAKLMSAKEDDLYAYARPDADDIARADDEARAQP